MGSLPGLFVLRCLLSFFFLLIMGMSVPGYVHMYSGAPGIRHGYWKSDLVPLQEQYMLLTTKPSSFWSLKVP